MKDHFPWEHQIRILNIIDAVMILFPIWTCLVYIPRILGLLGPAVYFNAENVIVELLQCEVLSWRQFCFIVPVPSRCGGWSVPTVSKIVHELLEIMQQPCSAQPLLGTGLGPTPRLPGNCHDVWVSLNIWLLPWLQTADQRSRHL